MTDVKHHQLQGRGCLSCAPLQDQAECLCCKASMFPLPFSKQAQWKTQACSGRWNESYSACCFLPLLRWDKGQQYQEGLIYTTNWLILYYHPFVFAFPGYNIILLIREEMLTSALMWKQTGNRLPENWKNEKSYRSFLIKCHLTSNQVGPGSRKDSRKNSA